MFGGSRDPRFRASLGFGVFGFRSSGFRIQGFRPVSRLEFKEFRVRV